MSNMPNSHLKGVFSTYFIFFLLPYVSYTLSLRTVLFTVHLPAQLSSFVSMLQMGVAASDPRHDSATEVFLAHTGALQVRLLLLLL